MSYDMEQFDLQERNSPTTTRYLSTQNLLQPINIVELELLQD